jgi:putative thioredoxin
MQNPTSNPAQNPTFSYDVTDADFETLVLERSLEVPVLLDCWAPWCGPCKSLGPVLEKLAQEYGGRFVLAKLDTDQNPEIAGALQLRSIPHVVLFKGGQVADHFTGALPESKIKAFLEPHLPPAPADAEPDPDPLDDAAALIETGALEDAARLLDMIPAEVRDDRHAALLARLKLASERPPGDKAALEARIASNSKDFEARFALAAILAYENDFNGAFDQLLEVVMRDKLEWREKARLQLVEWFAVCGNAEAVSRGRRYLGMYLN